MLSQTKMEGLVKETKVLFEILKTRVERTDWGGIDQLLVSVSARSPESEAYEKERSLWKKLLDRIYLTNPKMLSIRLIEDRLLFGVIQKSIAFVDEEENFDTGVSELLQQFSEFETSRTVRIPLILLLVREELVFGKITFKEFTEDDKRKEWWARIADPRDSDANLLFLSYAEIVTRGPDDLALSDATNGVLEHILVIRGMGFPITAKDVSQVGLIGDTSWRGRIPFEVVNFKQNYRLEAETVSVTRLGAPIGNYDLARELGIDLANPLVQRIGLMLRADKRTEMEGRILQAFRWIGEATKPDTLEARFVKMSLALESLLSEEGRGIKDALAEKSAFLAADYLAGRIDVHKKIAAYYKIRSDIVHGKKILVRPEELEDYGLLVRQVVFKAVEKLDLFDTPAKFKRWVLEVRYENNLTGDSKP